MRVLPLLLVLLWSVCCEGKSRKDPIVEIPAEMSAFNRKGKGASLICCQVERELIMDEEAKVDKNETKEKVEAAKEGRRKQNKTLPDSKAEKRASLDSTPKAADDPDQASTKKTVSQKSKGTRKPLIESDYEYELPEAQEVEELTVSDLPQAVESTPRQSRVLNGKPIYSLQNPEAAKVAEARRASELRRMSRAKDTSGSVHFPRPAVGVSLGIAIIGTMWWCF